MATNEARTTAAALPALIRETLAAPTARGLAELSDYGINLLRETLPRETLEGGLVEEYTRCQTLGINPTAAGYDRYLRTPRLGSPHRLNRRLRSAVFAQLVGRRAL